MAHRYWRLDFTASNSVACNGISGYFGLSEIVFASTFGGATLFGSGTPAATFSTAGPNGPQVACDGNTATIWGNTTNAAIVDWSYDFGSGVTVDVREVKITSRNDFYWQQVPTVFNLQYSDDNSTWFTVQNFVATGLWAQKLAS